MPKKKSSSEVAQLIRFVAVGVVNTLVDFVVLNVLVVTLLPKTASFGNLVVSGQMISLNGVVVAGVISGTVAMIVSFLLNSRFTFRIRHVARKRIVYFFTITAFGLYIIRPAILKIMTGAWVWPSTVVYKITSFLRLPFSQSFDERNTALAAAILIVLSYNYLMYKYFVFVDEKQVKQA
ncbi:GtrA family protein [Candidatus Saccharibacteria bacterium]|nr:GtrA family protein [Candidatus Saccharibacteria bacterium]